MTCKNCGASLPDNVLFCSECGAKIEAEISNKQTGLLEKEQTQEQTQVQVSVQTEAENQAQYTQQYQSENQTQYPANNQQSAMSQVSSEQQSFQPDFGQTHDYTGGIEAPITKKKKKKGKVFLILGICLGVLALLAILGLFLWRTVFFAAAPEKYTSLIIYNTVTEITDEASDIKKNILGFDASLDKDLTIGVNVEYDDIKVDATIANMPGKKQVVGEATLKDGDRKATAQGFLDDKYAGICLPGSDGDYLVIPSKDFGKELDDSDGYLKETLDENADDQIMDILENLDISYSNIVKNASGDSKASKELKEILSEQLIDLLKNSDIGSRESVKYKFENGTVNAKEITIDIKTKDAVDFMINILKEMQENKVLKETYGKATLDSFDEAIDSLKDSKKNLDVNNFTVILTEYKGKVVQAVIEYEQDKSEFYDKYDDKTTITLSTTDKKHILNGVKCKVDFESKYSNDGDYKPSKWSSTSELELIANWVDEDEKINVKIIENNDREYSDQSNCNSEDEYWLEIDYSKGKWKAGVNGNYVDKYDGETYKDSYEYEYDGKCSKKKGFTFNLDHEIDNSYTYDDYNCEYDEWLDSKFDDLRYDYFYDLYEDSYYTSYASWYNNCSDYYDSADYRFESWLEDYYDLESTWDLYEDDELETITVTDINEIKVDVNISNKADLKIKDRDYNNVLDWDEDDFEDFLDAFQEEIR